MTTDGARSNVPARLSLLASRLEAELGSAIDVLRNADLASVDLQPRRTDACPVSWMKWGDGIILSVGARSCRWELGEADEDIDFIESIVEAVIAGRVTEVFAPSRSQVEVQLLDGERKRMAAVDAPVGCLPMPMWPRWGRRVIYRPYV